MGRDISFEDCQMCGIYDNDAYVSLVNVYDYGKTNICSMCLENFKPGTDMTRMNLVDHPIEVYIKVDDCNIVELEVVNISDLKKYQSIAINSDKDDIEELVHSNSIEWTPIEDYMKTYNRYFDLFIEHIIEDGFDNAEYIFYYPIEGEKWYAFESKLLTKQIDTLRSKRRRLDSKKSFDKEEIYLKQ